MFILKQTKVLRQYIIVIVANFSYLCFGLESGWPSPVMAKLKDANQTVLPYLISDSDAAWVPSIGILSGICTMLISGSLMDRFGRKRCLILLTIPRLFNCMLLIFASELWMLLLGRALNGVTDSFGVCLLFTYTSEIASKEVRGALGTISQLSYTIGIMIMRSVGPFLSYFWLNIMNTIIVYTLFVPQLFIPETPYFLYSRGRKEEAIEVLTYIRGSKEAAYEELEDYTLIQASKTDKHKLFQDVTAWKSLGKGVFLICMAQFTGYNTLSFYLQSIFASTHSSITSETSSLVIGFIEIMACLCTIMMTDRFGRKPILTVSLILMAVGMCGFGTFFYFKDRNFGVTRFLDSLPLISIALTIFFYNTGLGSLMMMYIAELFDGASRATGISICFLTGSLFAFLLVRFFGLMTDAIGPMSIYYGFAVCCVILCLFVAFCLSETKGKSFSQIQKELKGSGKGKTKADISDQDNNDQL